jgi:hypothetical protein
MNNMPNNGQKIKEIKLKGTEGLKNEQTGQN